MNAEHAKGWKEFTDSGMLWWINRILHTFGWSIFISVGDEGIVAAYPKRTTWLGFTRETDEARLQDFQRSIGAPAPARPSGVSGWRRSNEKPDPDIEHHRAELLVLDVKQNNRFRTTGFWRYLCEEWEWGFGSGTEGNYRLLAWRPDPFLEDCPEPEWVTALDEQGDES